MRLSRRQLFSWTAAFTGSAHLRAIDWPQWRGPERDGTSRETGLLKSWPAGGPRLLWKAQGLGEGYSAFAISQGRLFTQGQRANRGALLAFDAATGKKLWEKAIGGGFRESRGNGPRGTPTVDGDRLFALGGEGSLVCVEAATAKEIWNTNIVKRFGGSVLNWGISESPLVDGDRLIVTPGGRRASVVALDKQTGNLIWQSQSDEAGYSSAIAVDVGGLRVIVVFTGEAALGLAATNGELLWRYDRVSNRTANVATPIHRDGYVFFSSDYGTGCALLKLARTGGGVTATEAYFNRNMRNHYSSSVLVGDHIYGFSASVLTAMVFLSGAVVWRDRSVGKGSVAYADGHLYCLSEDGVMGLVEAVPAGYREKSRFSLPRASYPTWTPPVISGGKLYLRDQDNLYCHDLLKS